MALSWWMIVLLAGILLTVLGALLVVGMVLLVHALRSGDRPGPRRDLPTPSVPHGEEAATGHHERETERSEQ